MSKKKQHAAIGTPLAATPPSQCPSPITVKREHVIPGTGEIVREDATLIPCRCKTCSHCGAHLLTQQTAHYTRELDGRPNLKFLTFMMANDMSVSPLAARGMLNETWKHFCDLIKYACKKAGEKFVWVLGIGPNKRGYPHLHVVASIPLDEREIRELWMKSGGSIQCDIVDLPDTHALACRIRYTLRNGFEDGRQARKEGYAPKSIRSSKGIGFYSTKAKAERRRFWETHANGAAPAEGESLSQADFEDFLATALEQEPGQLVITPDGYGSYIRLREGIVDVLLEDVDLVRQYPLFDVTPVHVELPCVEMVVTPRPYRRRTYTDKITHEEREAFARMREGCRLVRCTHTDARGRRIEWVYDRETGKMTDRVLE